MEPKRSPLLPIFLIVLVDVFGFTLVIPLLSIYAEHFHASPFEATLLVSSYAACQLFSGPLLGRISDSIGRKPMLFVSQVGTFIGFLVMARANALWMLYLARVIDGATAGNLSLAQAYISDNTKPENRAKSFAVIGIAFGVGFFVGPAVTGYLSTFGLPAPIYCAAGLSMTSILCTLLLLPGGKPPGHSATPGPGGARLSIFRWGTYVEYLKRPALAPLFAQFVCFIFAFSTFMSGFALFAERRFQWDSHPFGPRENWLSLRLLGGARHRAPRGGHGATREAFRRVAPRHGGLLFLASGPTAPRCRARCWPIARRRDDFVVRDRGTSPSVDEFNHTECRAARARGGARNEPVASIARADPRPSCERSSHHRWAFTPVGVDGRDRRARRAGAHSISRVPAGERQLDCALAKAIALVLKLDGARFLLRV
jgi:hypothetical protein